MTTAFCLVGSRSLHVKMSHYAWHQQGQFSYSWESLSSEFCLYLLNCNIKFSFSFLNFHDVLCFNLYLGNLCGPSFCIHFRIYRLNTSFSICSICLCFSDPRSISHRIHFISGSSGSCLTIACLVVILFGT